MGHGDQRDERESGLTLSKTGPRMNRILKIFPPAILALVCVAVAAIAYWNHRVDEIVSGSKLIVVGEGHGSIEAPAFVEHTMERLLASGKNVTLGLEISSSEQARIDRYLSSAGAPSDYAALVGGAWWLKARQTAQATEAIAHLVEAARLQKQRHPSLRAVAIDEPATDPTLPGAYDLAMAAAVEREAADASRVVLVLVGNSHATKAAISPTRDSTHRSMANLLASQRPVSTINVDSFYGSTYACPPPCQPGLVANFMLNTWLIGGFDAPVLYWRFSPSPPANKSAMPSRAAAASASAGG
jgi:hypothetical protein